MIEIIPLSEKEARKLWNEFIKSTSAVVPFSFNPAFFGFYRDYFHWIPLYFILYRQDKPVGIFPLVQTGKTYVSLPHFSYGGLYAESVVPDVYSLIQRLVDFVDKEFLSQGFYRYELPSEEMTENKALPASLFFRSLNPLGEPAAPVKETSFMELSGTQAEQWHLLSSNLRRKIRKAGKCGITFQQGGKELMNDFYAVYARKMHQLGSPPYGKGFFSSFLNTSLKDDSTFFVAYSGSHPVGAALLLSYNGFYESAWFATASSHQKYYVADGLHWAMIKHAIGKDGRIYSLGRSTKNSGVYVYKNHWPVQNHPLFIYNTSDRNSVKKYVWLSKLWKLVPLPVANWLGPKLVKNIY